MVKFLTRLFENGYETYDRQARKTQNIGGAQLWNSLRWKGDSSEIMIHNEPLRKALFSLPLSCFTLSRADMNDGKVVHVEGSTAVSRICQALMFYPQLDNDRSAQVAYDRIMDACPELEGYVDILGRYKDVLTNISPDILENGCIPTDAARIVNRELGEEIPLNIDRCILLAVGSGSEESAQYWGNRPKASSRRTNSQAVRGNAGVTSDDLPF